MYKIIFLLSLTLLLCSLDKIKVMPFFFFFTNKRHFPIQMEISQKEGRD